MKTLILFRKASFKDRPGYWLGVGPRGQRRWMKMAFGQRPGLFGLAPIPVTTISGLEFGEHLNRVQLAQAADQALRQLQAGPPLPNHDTGWRWVIGAKDRRKMGDNADLTRADSQAIAVLPRLMWRAVLAESHEDMTHHNPQVLAIHRFYAPLQIGAQVFRVKLTVKDYSAAFQRRNLHALETVEIENAPLPGTLLAHESPPGSKRQTQPTTVERTISIADLLRGASRDRDGQPFAPLTPAPRRG